MKKAIAKEWARTKKELAENIQKTIENGNSDSATLEMMLSMLENSKLKNRRKNKK